MKSFREETIDKVFKEAQRLDHKIVSELDGTIHRVRVVVDPVSKDTRTTLNNNSLSKDSDSTKHDGFMQFPPLSSIFKEKRRMFKMHTFISNMSSSSSQPKPGTANRNRSYNRSIFKNDPHPEADLEAYKPSNQYKLKYAKSKTINYVYHTDPLTQWEDDSNRSPITRQSTKSILEQKSHLIYKKSMTLNAIPEESKQLTQKRLTSISDHHDGDEHKSEYDLLNEVKDLLSSYDTNSLRNSTDVINEHHLASGHKDKENAIDIFRTNVQDKKEKEKLEESRVVSQHNSYIRKDFPVEQTHHSKETASKLLIEPYVEDELITTYSPNDIEHLDLMPISSKIEIKMTDRADSGSITSSSIKTIDNEPIDVSVDRDKSKSIKKPDNLNFALEDKSVNNSKRESITNVTETNPSENNYNININTDENFLNDPEKLIINENSKVTDKILNENTSPTKIKENLSITSSTQKRRLTFSIPSSNEKQILLDQIKRIKDSGKRLSFQIGNSKEVKIEEIVEIIEKEGKEGKESNVVRRASNISNKSYYSNTASQVFHTHTEVIANKFVIDNSDYVISEEVTKKYSNVKRRRSSIRIETFDEKVKEQRQAINRPRFTFSFKPYRKVVNNKFVKEDDPAVPYIIPAHHNPRYDYVKNKVNYSPEPTPLHLYKVDHDKLLNDKEYMDDEEEDEYFNWKQLQLMKIAEFRNHNEKIGMDNYDDQVYQQDQLLVSIQNPNFLKDNTKFDNTFIKTANKIKDHFKNVKNNVFDTLMNEIKDLKTKQHKKRIEVKNVFKIYSNTKLKK